MVSKSQIDRLGDRMRKGTPRDGDDELLHEFLATHDEVLAQLVDELRAIELPNGRRLEPTSRVKTIDTLVEKLVREPIGLSSIRDVAGARVTVGETLEEQDVVRDLLAEHFNASKVVDRRADPRSGYRAVHVIVKYGGCWAEIQVRTRLQHRWAEAYERVADTVGRGVRYGEIPEPGSRALGLVEGLHVASKRLATAEITDQQIGNLRQAFHALADLMDDARTTQEARALIRQFEDSYELLRLQVAETRKDLEDILPLFVSE